MKQRLSAWIILLITVAICLASCSKTESGAVQQQTGSVQSAAPQILNDDKYVSAVRVGTLGGYDTTTIGKAFDATFQNPKWASGETNKGARFVEFNGMLPEKLYKQQYLQKIQARESDCAARRETVEYVRKNPYWGYLQHLSGEKIGGDDTGFPRPQSLLHYEDLVRDDYAALKGDSAQAKDFEQFYAKMTSENVADCGVAPGEEEQFAKVTFQWTFTADESGFRLSYIDMEPWRRVSSLKFPGSSFELQFQSPEDILAYIYR